MENNVSKVARQKIVNKDNELFAYELLYRNEITEVSTDDDLTMDVLVTSFFKIGYSSISDGAKVAVNFGNSNLLDNVSQLITPEHLIFEILETTEMNAELIDKLKKIKEKGFLVALDDFKIETIENEEIYNYVDIIKVDFIATNEEEKNVIEDIARKYPNITLLAEKIENFEEYTYALNSGYSLFQGYYISKPEVISAS